MLGLEVGDRVVARPADLHSRIPISPLDWAELLTYFVVCAEPVKKVV